MTSALPTQHADGTACSDRLAITVDEVRAATATAGVTARRLVTVSAKALVQRLQALRDPGHRQAPCLDRQLLAGPAADGEPDLEQTLCGWRPVR